MRYWWVNQNQTYKQEIAGGYLWSPRTNKNGGRNQFYDNMRLVEPGDVVFSFADQKIQQIGMATARAVPCPKPLEFGQTGGYWSNDGWLVNVTWESAEKAIRPKDYIADLRPHLPAIYAPLDANGKGRQNLYLAEISLPMAEILLAKLGLAEQIKSAEAFPVEPGSSTTIFAVEAKIEEGILNNTEIDSTSKTALILARRGQGRFRKNLEGIEKACRITGVTDRRLLRASHIKPWRMCETNHERLDGNNGLLLTPTFDVLFDAGYISFSADGSVLVSDAIGHAQLAAVGLGNPTSLPRQAFSAEQTEYLKYHHTYIFERKRP